MAATPEVDPASPTLAEQVSRLYDLIAGYHLTNLIEIAREVGVWERIATQPGIDSRALAAKLGTDPHYTDVLCRTAFAFELLEREGDGWRMAAHMDAILGEPASAFYLGRAARVHMTLGAEDYPDLADRLRSGRVVPYQDHGDALIEEIADSLRSLPRMFVDLVLPRLPSLDARLTAGARVLDLGCGAGWAIVELAERFPASRFSAVAQWFELTWGNEIDTAAELRDRCARAGLRLADETAFSRFTIIVADKPA